MRSLVALIAGVGTVSGLIVGVLAALRFRLVRA